MKRFWWASSALIVLGGLLLACGGSTTNPNQPVVSGLTKRVLASNSFSGVINIIDASQDVFSNHLFQVAGSQPQQMSLAQDRSVTLVFNPAASSIIVLSNSTEQPLTLGISLPGHSDAFAALNNATGFATVRNANQVVVLDLTNLKIAQTISVQTPGQIALAHN